MSSYVNIITEKIINIPNDGIIIECGSRDCLDAIEMLGFYHPKKIYSFECNPESIQICRKNILEYDKISLIESAVGNIDGSIDFYATDMEKSQDKNIGASSALFHIGGQKEYVQKKITVPSLRLDTFIKQENIEKIDLLCMDLQGYEKIALEGLGDFNNISYIITEVSFQSYYQNNVLFDELNSFLKNKGFVCEAVWPQSNYANNTGFGDAIFKRSL